MKKLFLLLLTVFTVVLFVIFGCSKSESPTSPAAPTATHTPTFTPVPTSTIAPSPNISGNLFLPASAVGKSFIVIADTDENTANGYSASYTGICPDATSINYSMQVTDGTYYVYAYIDVNDSGLTGPGAFDYFGVYAGNPITTPDGGVDITLDQIPITVTLNVTQPGDASGRQGFFGIFSNNDYSIITTGPVAGADIICPSGTSYQVTFTVDPADIGTYYLIGMVDADGSCGGSGCFPQEGDYIKVYGGSGVNWPASPNVTVNGDITLNLALVNVIPNVSGTAYLPASVSNKEYTVYVSTVPLSGADMSSILLLTKTANVSGSSIPYSIFAPLPGPHYITFIMDIDGSGWDNTGSGPISTGDYEGVYGVPTPILNWMAPFPPTPNANLPGSGFNIYCDTYPGQPPSTPTPIPTPTPGGQTGNITVNLSIPSGQTGKPVSVFVDMDLNPTNGNIIAQATAIVSGSSQQFILTNIPVGSYYIYAATSSIDGPPMAGDAVGIYGTTFPNIPSSPNANVTNGGNLNANITMVIATNNLSGRVYMPYSVPNGRQWAVIIDYDLDGGNGFLGMATGSISNANTYFDYNMFLPLPGNYYIYAIVDVTGNGFDNGPDCGDLMGLYSYPQQVYFTPSNNYTNININTNDWMLCK
jgi:hypothetical protein